MARQNNHFQFVDVQRNEPNKIKLRERKNQFDEIHQPFKPSQAHRCLDCGNP
jgi:glutamate synthase (NADPH/NADH) small chain